MYNKTIWKDRVVDPVSGAVVQEGTFMSAEHFNNIEDGIAAVDSAIADIRGGYEDIEEALETGVGTTVSLTLNQSTFVLNLALKNSKGTKISEQSVDLPIESMIVNAEYVASTKSLVLTLQSGSKVTVPLSGLISGLVNDTRKVAGIDLKDDITVSELKTALDVDDLEQNKVNKTTTVNGKALSSNITLAGSDLKLNATSYTKDTTAKTISKDTKVDEAVAQIEYRLDKKVDKATASTSQYTTSTVTVPACLGYAGIKMVGGKTIKDGDVLKSAPIGKVVSMCKNYIDSSRVVDGSWYSTSVGDSNPYYKRIDYKISAGTYEVVAPSVNDDSYIIVCIIPGNDNSAIVVQSGTTKTISLDSEWSVYSQRLDASTGDRDVVEYLISNTLIASTSFHKATISVPGAISNLPDYGRSVPKADGSGDIYNYVDFNEMKYYHNVASVDLGSLTWSKILTDIFYSDGVSNIKMPRGYSVPNILSSKYEAHTPDEIGQKLKNGITISPEISRIAVYPSDAQSPTGTLVYELATPKVIDISSLIPPIPCEQGGTITLVNEHSLDVPNKIVFKKEVN